MTNDLGWYAWDVPEGLWQVKYEKLNFEETYSEWLQVPPPQLDVNVNIISFVQPEIKRVTAYDTRIEIEFTKYMILSKLNLTNIVVTRNGNDVNGSIAFANSEIDPTNKSNNYASLIHFIPEQNFEINEYVNVLIKKEVESYSGVTMNSDFSEIIKIVLEPKITLDSETTNITYGNVKKLNYNISITPIESMQGKKIFLEIDSQNIINLDSNSISVENDEQIQIPVKINFSGNAQITMTLEGTGIKAVKKINVNTPKMKLSPVISSIESNSKVDINTPIELYSNIPDCAIYFTTDQSIDINSWQVYKGSVIISNDIILSAIAKHNDYEESEPSTFYYSVYRYYTVYFDANGGESNMMFKNVKENELFGELPIPTRLNYLFDGWFTNLMWEKQITSDSLVDISSNITLHAKWTINEIDPTTKDQIFSKTETVFIATKTENSIKIDDVKLESKASLDDEIETSVTLIHTDMHQFDTENENSIDQSNNSNKNGKLIGIVVGCVVAIIVIIISVIIITLIIQRKPKILRVENMQDIESIDL